uniref:Putative secreted protein n=1 Tax=Anopheles darlingi TaxID=43151 RepID=A0A2M4DJE2_ANODA
MGQWWGGFAGVCVHHLPASAVGSYIKIEVRNDFRNSDGILSTTSSVSSRIFASQRFRASTFISSPRNSSINYI